MYVCKRCGHDNSYFVRFKFNPGRQSSIVPCSKCGSEMVGDNYYYSYLYLAVFHFACIYLLDSKDSILMWGVAFTLNILVLYVSLPLKHMAKI
jgi:hypothetical protein